MLPSYGSVWYTKLQQIICYSNSKKMWEKKNSFQKITTLKDRLLMTQRYSIPTLFEEG